MTSTNRDRQGKGFVSTVEGMHVFVGAGGAEEGRERMYYVHLYVALDASAPLCLCKCVS